MPLAAQLPGGFFSEENGKDIRLPFGMENPEGAGIVWMEQTPSTNALLREKAADGAPHGLCVAARNQTAGRGQRGNRWEAEPGENLTFSLLLRPRRLRPDRQFALSQAVALGVAEVVGRHVADPRLVKVKWPNDIYVADRKIAGILIEHTLRGGEIASTVAGVGLNVNQRRFLSDAPNPVSLWQLTQDELLLEPLLQEVVDEIMLRFRMVDGDEDEAPSSLDGEYRRRLWRGEGYWPYRLPGDDQTFMGRIIAVAPNGPLTLETPDGDRQTFAFKEVEAVL